MPCSPDSPPGQRQASGHDQRGQDGNLSGIHLLRLVASPAPMEITLSEGARALQLDSSNRDVPAARHPRDHRAEQGTRLQPDADRQILPGATADLDIDTPDSTITANGPEGAVVYIDNERVGDIPVVNHQVKIGSRDIRVVDRSGAAYHITVNVTRHPPR